MKPQTITISPKIDTDPAKTYLIRVEGDRDRVLAFLENAERYGLDSYEIVQSPAGVPMPDNGCGCDQKPPCIGCKTVKHTAKTVKHTAVVHIMFEDLEGDDGDPCGLADDMVRDIRGLGIDAYLDDVTSPTSETDDDAPIVNKLNLYSIYTIDSHLAETDRVFIAALSKEHAIALFHKARARDWENEPCEIICNLIQSKEECDG